MPQKARASKSVRAPNRHNALWFRCNILIGLFRYGRGRNAPMRKRKGKEESNFCVDDFHSVCFVSFAVAIIVIQQALPLSHRRKRREAKQALKVAISHPSH